MDNIKNFFGQLLQNNDVVQLLVIFLIILGLFLTGRIISYVLKRIVKKTAISDKPVYATFMEAISKSITFLLIASGVLFVVGIIKVPANIQDIVSTSSNILMVIALGYFVYHLVDVPSIWFETLMDKTEKNLNKMFIPVIRKSLRVTVIVFVVIQIIQILSDKPITSIIAGLGIGGLAVALAAQDTIKHFIGSFVIAGDKPFEIGDRVVIDGFDGPVESIGLRTTRLRTLEGHLVSIPNGELANKTIQNIGKRPYIRRLANITITYDTPPEKIRRAAEIIKEILQNHEGMHEDFPPRVYFNDLNSDSLNIIMIYWYHPPDYWSYMEFTEKVNYQIFARFNEEGIDFAFPTQTLYLAGDTKRPLTVGVTNKEK
jgi:MscS family membrane protein